MWKRAVDANRRTIFASLRDGYTLKQTLNGLLRGESLEKADLSDLLDLKWKSEGVDIHEIHILVLQIALGKYTYSFSVLQYFFKATQYIVFHRKSQP